MIAHFASQLGGGANIAGRRLHEALRRNGLESYFYYGAGESADPSYVPVYQNRSFFWRNAAALAISWRSRKEAPGGFVTGPGWIRKTPIQATGKLPSVVNLHWVPRWLDVPSFFASLPPALPVIWTLHDLIPITGGCHYPLECDGFTKQCGNCPQQKRPHPHDATRGFFNTKADWYKKINLHFVGNSEWTTAQAGRSKLAEYARSVRTIHYGLDVEQYKPVEKEVARKALRIPEGRFVIGFSCLDFNERRKGAEILMEALKSFPAGEIVLLVLGAGQWPGSNVQTIPMGSLGTPRLQSLFYSALDVFAMPSRVETFGNVAMEAMACETPVAAYPAGGLADVVADGETGLLEPEIGSVTGLVRMLQWMWKHPAERRAMGKAARVRVIRNFSDSLMANRYTELYHELAPDEKSFRAASPGKVEMALPQHSQVS
jgi:glycosyltransferase involved in cell wall biosynthesis